MNWLRGATMPEWLSKLKLCTDLQPGDRVFRPDVGAFGRNNLGAYFKETFGYTCGVLRKSVEQRASDVSPRRQEIRLTPSSSLQNGED